jgi:ferrous iron transport protein A
LKPKVASGPEKKRCGLSGLCLGQRCRVVCVDPDGALSCRLLELGLTPGTEFTVTKIAPLGDPIEISVRGTRLCLRKHETQEITVERVG